MIVPLLVAPERPPNNLIRPSLFNRGRPSDAGRTWYERSSEKRLVMVDQSLFAIVEKAARAT